MTEDNLDFEVGETVDEETYQILVNGSPLPITNATLTARKVPKGPIALTLGIGTGLTLISGPNAQIRRDRQVLNIEPGRYSYRLKTTHSDGTVLHEVGGSINARWSP